jgi:phosphonopyruvate decarboxylase
MEFRNGPRFVEVRVAPGARKDLGRPTTSPADNKRVFMEMLGSDAAAGS